MDDSLRKILVDSLHGGQAFESAEAIFNEVPTGRRFVPAASGGRSAWQIVEHMRLSIEVLVSYSGNFDGTYQEKEWPEGYWPSEADPGRPEAWDEAVQGFLKAQKALEALAADSSRDPMAPFPWEPSHTLLREILLAIQHNAYHCGELVELTMVLQSQPKK
ncbi:MAG TPA: DinB family protein [Fimbriimonas sp.]|nr:DinB family protein [Fimbriimonas sp.]